MDLDELRAFLAVVEAGSMSAGSRATGIVRSTLARRIESMERRLGVRLLISTEQGVELTARGKVLAEQGPRVLAEARALELSIMDRPSELARAIRCIMPQGVHPAATAEVTSRVNARHPGVVWHFETSADPFATLANGEADMALVWGPSRSNGPFESTLIREIPVGLLASPEYLDPDGAPRDLAELEHFHILLWSYPGLPEDHLPLADGGFHRVAPKAKSRDPMALYGMAQQGSGIALMPCMALPGDRWAEEAVAVLPQTVGTRIAIRLIYPRSLAETRAVGVMLEASLEFFGELSG